MLKNKVTRSSGMKEDPGGVSAKKARAPALCKVFYISEKLVEDASHGLRLERFYHPGRGKATFFITSADKQLMEVVEFCEPRRSWLINNTLCSNGRVFLTTPVDATFLALHHIRKHCGEKFMALDQVHDGHDTSTMRLLGTFVRAENLQCAVDVKTVDEMVFYKYNPEKAMAWLAVKTHRVADRLRIMGVHCGHSALSQNYARSGKVLDEAIKDIDYLRVACDIVGSYVDADLHENLSKFLRIPTEINAKFEEKKKASNKRKPAQELISDENKKVKLDESHDSLLNDSNEPVKCADMKTAPLKERTLTAKEKAFAKGAKGTMSIASFFKK